jgi:beta-lactamase regulating signal transducer with metallopeptidase domain
METLVHAASTVSAAAVSSLVSAIWEGAVLSLSVVVSLRLLPRLSANARSLIWMNVFLLLLLLHVVPSFLSEQTAGRMVHAAHWSLDVGWSIGLAGLWMALSLWRAAQLMVSAVRLHGLASRAIPVEADGALQAILQGHRERGRGGRGAELCTSMEVERPSVLGFFRPRILIPPALMESLCPEDLRQVVVHEMEHLRRGDDWTNLLQKVGLALFPLNPALLWVERRVCAERELACDDRVLHSGGARKAYAACLTRLAEYAILRRSLSLALGAWERQSELVRRVNRVLRSPDDLLSARQGALVTGSLLAGVLGGAIALTYAPQIVSFGPGARAQSAEQARSVVSVDLREAGYRKASLRDSEGRMQLVKAVMAQRPVPSAFPARLGQSKAVRRTVRRALPQSRQAWIVLTDWSDAQVPPQLVLAVAPGSRVSYAALPIPEGWLIVQI